MSDIVFTTIHGSHLYGMAHEGSDKDTFIVTTSTASKARHRVSQDGTIDRVTVGLDLFLRRAFEGSHQAVEALFSPYKEWGDTPVASFHRAYLEGMRITGGNVFAKYERTIKTFCYGDFKRRRHAVRLSLNLRGLRENGMFNPVLSTVGVATVNYYATHHKDEDLWEVLR
jgi:hypothetical protein